jgi:AraC family transcriptional regulator, positive regulator of tynA and feaB
MNDSNGSAGAAEAGCRRRWERLLDNTFAPGRVTGFSGGLIERKFHTPRLLVAQISLAPQMIEHGLSHLQSLPAESRASVIAHVVIEGSGFIEQGGKNISFGQGDVSFRSFDAPSRVVFATPAKIFAIKLSACAMGLTTGGRRGSLLASPKVVGRSRLLVDVAQRLLCGISDGAASDIERLCALSAVSWLVAGAYHGDAPARADSPTSNALRWQMVMAYVEGHLFESETLSPTSCAENIGISTRYLHKLFAQQGLKFSRFVLERRLEAAHALLRDAAYRSHSIASIAYQCGFASAAHFSRSFRGRFAMSPKQCRNLPLLRFEGAMGRLDSAG